MLLPMQLGLLVAAVLEVQLFLVPPVDLFLVGAGFREMREETVATVMTNVWPWLQ